MRILKIAAICGTILLMGMAKNPVSFEKNASITVECDSCLSLDNKNSIKIRLKNKSKNDYWINTWNISTLLQHENGKTVEQASGVIKNAPEGPFEPQFKLLKGSASFEIIKEINFSEEYKISSAMKYQIECYYENSLEMDNTKFKTLIGYAPSNSVSVSFCK